MAIDSLEKIVNKWSTKYTCKRSNGCKCHPNETWREFDLHAYNRISSDGGSNQIIDYRNAESPYLKQGSTQLLARETQKKLGLKKVNIVKSPIPIAVNIYKASSDDFQSQKIATKKNKKSVLTLPNVPAAIPQICTVSDMNDSKYLNTNENSKPLKKSKKRCLAQNKQSKIRSNNSVLYDRNDFHYSQVSKDYKAIDAFTGDGKNVPHKALKNNQDGEKNISFHDVWPILKDINRSQFRSSSPISDDSMKSPKRRKFRNKKRHSRTNKRLIERYRAEEFEYISSLELDSKSRPSLSQSSNFDRITVIDKQKTFDAIRYGFQSSSETNRKLENSFQTNTKHNTINNTNNIFKCVGNVKNNKQIITIDKKEMVKQEVIKINASSKINTMEANHDENNVNPRLSYKMQKLQKDLKNSYKSIYSSPLYRLDSGSSKVAVSYVHKNSKEDILLQDIHKECTHTNGVTALTHNKDNYFIRPPQLSMQQNKRFFVTTLPSTVAIPKLTKTEIRRRLANLKFPIVILERDQLGASAIQITNSAEPVQFAGLDKHIWPFMTDWHPQTKNKIEKEKGANKQKHKRIKSIYTQTENKQNISNKRSTIMKEPEFENHKKVEYCQRKNKRLKHLRSPESKNTQKFFDRNEKYVLNSKYELKNSPVKKSKFTNTKKKYDACTDMFRFEKNKPHTFSNTAVNLQEFEDQSMICRYPWENTPLNNVVDTILTKIKDGVFYIKEENTSCKDNSVQTIISEDIETVKNIFNKETKEIGSVKNIILKQMTRNDYNTYVPGFDNNFTALEVKTLTMNELLVKDCIANVVVQFDVVVISNLAHRNTEIKSMSPIPLVIAENNTKVFKCKSSILNARLPAEICSMLPHMLKHINDTNRLQNSNSKITHDDFLNSSQHTLPPMKQLIGKMFSITLQKRLKGPHLYDMMKTRINIPLIDMKSIIGNVLPISLHCQSILTLYGNRFPLVSPYLSTAIQKESCLRNCTKINNCTTLAIYKPPQINSIFEDNQRYKPTFSFIGILDQKQTKKNINVICYKFEAIYNKTQLLIHLKVQNELQQNKLSLFNIKDTKINSVLNAAVQYNENGVYIDISPKKPMEYKSITSDPNMNNINVTRGYTSAPKKARKGFLRLYSRCKSASSLERTRTPLSKINTLEDFVRALGCGKLLASMFDGHLKKKILSSVSEMRNWITEISQRQAMLVLLLANKKDTSNLIRFRPILLQGVAVNRITRVSELDMEIEVIEREHFPKFSQYDGMAYSQDVENQNNLMEEIYWIAKTTASDYQKPFNGSSEKLLRSLLEKRKKLNPSYLRVMARYVGMGLLKPSRNY